MTATLGIVAGAGALPGKLVTACRAQGREVFVVALEGEAEADVIDSAPHAWVRLGAAGRMLRLLHEAGCEEVVLAGPIHRPALSRLRPDRRGARILSKLLTASGGDDSLLSVVVKELEGEGFRVVGADDVLAELLATPGCWGRLEPGPAATADIERGVAVVRALGTFDVGQAAVVQQGRVLGIEAAEGTDALLARCADLRLDGAPGVLIKLSKSGQQRRADLPTIGPQTVEHAASSGLAGIAVEAGVTLVLDRERVVELADGSGLFLCGVAAE